MLRTPKKCQRRGKDKEKAKHLTSIAALDDVDSVCLEVVPFMWGIAVVEGGPLRGEELSGRVGCVGCDLVGVLVEGWSVGEFELEGLVSGSVEVLKGLESFNFDSCSDITSVCLECFSGAFGTKQ